MSEAKIQIKVGIVEFSGEGSSEWLSAQLDKILTKVPELLKIELASPNLISSNNSSDKSPSNNSSKPTVSYATWLKDKNATTNQTRKFLATSAFLQLNGKDRVSTTDVSTTIKQYNQTRLGNPSDCLNSNVTKGHCEKDGKSFYVTPEGFKELGITTE